MGRCVARRHRRRQKKNAKAGTQGACLSAEITQISTDVKRIGRHNQGGEGKPSG